MEFDKKYWDEKYMTCQSGWDIGYISTPLKEYFDQLKDETIKILIPGCGNAYEAEYLYQKGFRNVFVIDWSDEALRNFKKRVPYFPDRDF